MGIEELVLKERVGELEKRVVKLEKDHNSLLQLVGRIVTYMQEQLSEEIAAGWRIPKKKEEE